MSKAKRTGAFDLDGSLKTPYYSENPLRCKRFCLLAIVVAWMGSALADDPQVDWNGETVSHGGDLNAGTNWVGGIVPEFGTTSDPGKGAYFEGRGAVTVPLTLGSSLYLNAMAFRAMSSVARGTLWDLDLNGNALKLYGYYDVAGHHCLYLYGGEQKMRVHNGTLDFTDAYLPKDIYQQVMVQNTDSYLLLTDPETKILGNPALRCFNNGTLILSNQVQSTGYFNSSRGGLIRVTGAGTFLDSKGTASSLGSEQGHLAGTTEILDGAVWTNANYVAMGNNGYGGTLLISNATVHVSTCNFGVGLSVYSSNNTTRVTGGAKVHVDTTTVANKGCITVGNGFNNVLEVSGATTELTGEGLTDNACSIVRIGELGWYNTFHLTDSARLSFSHGTIAVGANDNGVYRCDNVANTFRIDGGARLSVPQIQVGAVANRADMLNFYHRDANGAYKLDNTDTYLHSNSNLLEVSGVGTHVKVSGSVNVVSQGSLRYDAEQTGNGARVTDGAGFFAGSITVGARGRDNFFEVGDGASVTSSQHITVGGAASTNSTVSVAGGNLRVDTDYYRFYLKGSASADAPTCLNVSEGGEAYAYYVQTEGYHNQISISNGTVRSEAGFYFPFDTSSGDDQTFVFSGTNSVLKYESASNDFWFRGHTKFVFNIPTEGYCAVPIQGGFNVEISGSPTIEVNAKGYFATPQSRRTVLAQSGPYSSSVLNVSDEALASLNASVKDRNCRVLLSRWVFKCAGVSVGQSSWRESPWRWWLPAAEDRPNYRKRARCLLTVRLSCRVGRRCAPLPSRS